MAKNPWALAPAPALPQAVGSTPNPTPLAGKDQTSSILRKSAITGGKVNRRSQLVGPAAVKPMKTA